MSQEQTAPAAPVALTVESLERDHPQIFARLRETFTAQGAAAERDRIAGVRAQLVPGCEALIDKLAMDGKTTAGEAAIQVLAAQREAAAAAGAAQASAQMAHRQDAPQPLPSSAAPEGVQGMTKAEIAQRATRIASEKGIDFVDALSELGYTG